MWRILLILLFTFINFNSYTQDIEVTASKENFNHFDDRASISDFDSDELRQAGHLEKLIDNTPNLTFTGGTSRPRFFQIRGIGERSSYEGMPNSSVSILLDDIDYTGFAGVLSTYGLSSLEVYRGPQLSTKGPSALAGMIYAQSTTGANARGLKLSLARASFNTSTFSSQAGLKVGNQELSVVAQKNLSDGLSKNDFLLRSDTSNQDEETILLKYIYNFQASQLELNLHSFNFDNGYDVFNLENSFYTQSDHPGKDRQYTNGVSLKLETHSALSTYRTILSGHKTTTLYSYDEDWGNNSLWNNLSGWNADYDYHINFNKRVKTFSVEQHGERQFQKLLLTIGAYAKHYQESFSEIGFNGSLERKNTLGLFKRQTFASFLNADYSSSSKLTSFGGLRVESIQSQYFDNKGNSFKPRDLQTAGEFGLKYKHSLSNQFYLKIARGYKTGGLNTSSAVPLERKEFTEESLYSLEIGNTFKKSSSFSSKTSLFLMFRKDIQVKTSFQDDPSDPSSFTFYTDNATTGKSLGLEHESRVSFSPTYHLSFTGSLLRTRLGDYTYGNRNLRDREFAHAPEFSFTISPELNLTKNFKFISSYFLQDDFYFGNSHDHRAKSFQKLNLQLKYHSAFGSISLAVNNLFNKSRELRGFFFGNRPPSFTSERFVQLGDARSLKLQIDLNII